MGLATLSSLFRTKPVTQDVQTIYAQSSDNLYKNETYAQYGIRICGKVTASLNALNPFLLKVFNTAKKQQVEDEQQQTAYKEGLQAEIDSISDNIANAKSERESQLVRIDTIKERIEDLKTKLNEAKISEGNVNRMARMKLILGMVILIIMTVYLFVFYSSTFYSAFFKEFTAEISIGAAMFDAQALPHAFSAGFGELIFIISAPIIFMGLGYCLHFFNQQTNKSKYLKIVAILIITFIFDCILAYLIGKKIHDIIILTTLGEVKEFTISLAIKDINVWAVIFCGFIVYLIWGIVFDMTLSAYDNLRSNRIEIENTRTKIDSQNEILSTEKQRLATIDGNIASLENKKENLTNKLNTGRAIIDYIIIERAISDFFAGWMTLMPTLKPSKAEQEEANNIFKKTISTLIPSKS